MINSVVLVGRITRDLEIRRGASGVGVLPFTLAVDDARKTADGNRATNFIPCKAFGNSADLIAKYCRKGSLIAVSGTLQSSTFERRDGTKATSIEVNVNNFTFCGAKTSQTSGDNTFVNDGENQGFTSDNSDDTDYGNIQLADDDLPF